VTGDRRAADYGNSICVKAARGKWRAGLSPTVALNSPAMSPRPIATGADVVMIGSLFAGTKKRRAKSSSFRDVRSRPIADGDRSGPCAKVPAIVMPRNDTDAESKLVPEGIEGRRRLQRHGGRDDDAVRWAACVRAMGYTMPG